MKKYTTLIFVLFVIQNICVAQRPDIDSLRYELVNAAQDTSRISILNRLAFFHRLNRPDSGIYYGNKAWQLARYIQFPEGEIKAMYYVVNSYRGIGNDAKALEIALEGIRIAEENNLPDKTGPLFSQLGHIHLKSTNYMEAIRYFRNSKRSFIADNDYQNAAIRQNYIGEVWLRLNNLDSAEYYCQSAYDSLIGLTANGAIHSIPLNSLGKVQLEKGDTSLAATYFNESVRKATGGSRTAYFNSIFSLAKYYQLINKTDSALHYALESLEIAMDGKFYNRVIDASVLLSNIYENGNLQKALEFNKMATAYKDTIFDLARLTSLENLIDFDEQQRQYELEAAREESQARIRMNAFLGSTFTLLVISFFLYRNNRIKQKAKKKIEQAFDQLKSTQSQLIQSEKMASLGELTAGIAHEIQNPLNFVNNFAEVSKELAEELNEEVLKTKIDTELISEIAGDLVTNQEKINHHGQRASGIVKGMLEHSRTSTGKKELTDINVLADEYLRLAYHGLRAKDKTFNAEFKMEFDESLPKINVVSQDIGRVLLNLINNAFYAVDKKAKLGIDGFKPEVKVTTEKVNDKVVIKVWDNGEGIPEQVRNKIFQPFFTTKPTGSGTGLGLSLAYDIVKAHGGELKVETEDGMGTRFIIHLLNS